MERHILDYFIRRFSIPRDLKILYHNRFSQSIRLVDAIRNCSFKTVGANLSFYIAELSLSELISAIRDEIRCLLLFVKGVPLSRWTSKRWTRSVDSHVSPDIFEDIYRRSMKGIDALLGPGSNIEVLSNADPGEVKDYFEIFSSLLFKFPDLKTQDAILLTTAITSDPKINYFVTSDGDLINLNRHINKAYNLQIIKPGRVFHRI